MSYLRLQDSVNRNHHANTEPLFAKNKSRITEKHALEEIKNFLPNNNQSRNLEATAKKTKDTNASRTAFDKQIQNIFKDQADNDNDWIIESWDYNRNCCIATETATDEEIWSYLNPIDDKIFENIFTAHMLHCDEQLEQLDLLKFMTLYDKMDEIEAAYEFDFIKEEEEQLTTEAEDDFACLYELPDISDIEKELMSAFE